MNVYELFIKCNQFIRVQPGVANHNTETNETQQAMKKKQRFMLDNISKDVIFSIKCAGYVYVHDFKYTVCCSEYLSISSCTMKWLFCFIIAVLTP